MANQGRGLGDLLNRLYGKTVMTAGPSTVATDSPFLKYGVLPPSYTSHTPMPSNAVAPSADVSALFSGYGEAGPSGASPSVSATPPQGPLSTFFPGGATPQQQNLMPDSMTNGLNAALPILLGAGLAAANSFGTGTPNFNPGWRPGPMQFARPSDAFAKLMMAQQQRRR
jgi:hypothetical protein